MSMSSGISPSGVRLDTISEGWSVVQKQLGMWVATAVVYAIITVVLSKIQNLLGLHVGSDGRTLEGSAALGFLFGLINLAVGAFLYGGLFRMALKAIRNEAISPTDLFAAGDVAPALIGAAFLTGLAVGLGTLLCIIPGLIVGALLMLTNPIIVDQRVGTMDGLSRSWNTLKPHMMSALIFLVVIAIVNIIGAIPCGLGLLITGPVSLVAVALVYRDFFQPGMGASNADSSLYPPIPNIPQ